MCTRWYVRRSQTRSRTSSNPAPVQIMIQVAEKVNVLHEAGVAHLDLQPQNLLWCQSEKAWSLSSFGRTSAFGEEAERGAMFLAYAAPEVATSWKEGGTTFAADPAIDVWSLGVRSPLPALLLLPSRSLPAAQHVIILYFCVQLCRCLASCPVLHGVFCKMGTPEATLHL